MIKMMPGLFRSVLFFLFLLPASSHGQDISYINYDIRDGLAGSTVYDVAQDADGFIWIATENGLSRFDGKNFKTFTVKDGLPDNEIIKLFVDSKNRVWLLPFKPAIAYYYKGEVYTAENDSSIRQLDFKVHPFSMSEDKEGNLLISELVQYHLIYKTGKGETIWKKENWVGLGASGVNAKGEFCVPFNRQLSLNYQEILNLKTREIKPLKNYIIQRIIIHPRCMVYKVKDDSVKVDFEENDSYTFYSEGYNFNYLANDQLAVFHIKGVDLYDLTSRSFIMRVLNNFKVNSCFVDREGNYWFGTVGAGVVMTPALNFRTYTTVNGSEPLAVNALTSTKSALLIGTEDAHIWQLDPASNHFSSLNKLLRYDVNNRITAITPLGEKGLMVGSEMGLSTSFPVKITHPGHKVKYSLRYAVKSISVHNKIAAIATHTNTVVLNLETDTIKTLRDLRSTCILYYNGRYYIGSLDGLITLDESGKEANLGDRHKELKERIIALDTTTDGTLWVVTKGEGLIGYYKDTIRYVINERDGITSNNGTCLYIKGDTMWLGTDKGLNEIVISPAGKMLVRKFTTSDGLLSNNITAIAGIGSTLYVGSAKGLTFFDPHKTSLNSKCNIALNGIYINGQYWEMDTTGFVLPHGDNDIRFDYAGISIKSGGSISYRYRLIGIHNDFRTTQDASLSFPSLPSGNYKLEIKAINQYGIESDAKIVRFTISPAFWERAWVRIIALAVIAALVAWIFRYRVNKIKQREKEKTIASQRIAELEQIALRSQMNPHFIFNSLNSIQQYVVEKDIRGANVFITDFSNLIRMTLDFSTKKEISLAEEVYYISTYLKLERSRLEDRFDYSVVIDPAVNTQAMYLPPLLVQPFVENSIRHGVKNLTDKKGEILIDIKFSGDSLLISIIDNGVGRDVSRAFKQPFKIQYQSKGIALSEERIASYARNTHRKANIDIIDLKSEGGKSEGTKVNIYLPVDA